ncbi:hypothetical protein M3Y94_00512100 [Aphelenchoides besseyi]|nr:hypothetical protein M3Y94_00512100 [Aphelenchoides besseyi]KAI6226048.1 hypothetical protein M3Y95_00760900 [Aphelenchoides besseyi]
MWTSVDWIEFLKTNCVDYPEEDIQKDATFLAQQKIDTLLFNDLIGIYDRDVSGFKQLFSELTSGNLIRLYHGIKGYAYGKGQPMETSTKLKECSYCCSQRKKPRIKAPLAQIRRSTVPPDSVLGVKQYVMYFIRHDATFQKCCAVAVSPTLAVTYCYDGDRDLTRRVFRGKKTISNGSFLELYFLYDDQRKPVKVEVVQINTSQDIVLLETVDGQKFFRGDIGDHIFEKPKVDQEVLAIGLSTDQVNQEAVIKGVVLNEEMKRGQMVVNFATCPADSGGGIFSQTNGLVGIVTDQCEEEEKTNFTRTLFVSSTDIKHGWESFLEESEHVFCRYRYR